MLVVSAVLPFLLAEVEEHLLLEVVLSVVDGNGVVVTSECHSDVSFSSSATSTLLPDSTQRPWNSWEASIAEFPVPPSLYITFYY